MDLYVIHVPGGSPFDIRDIASAGQGAVGWAGADDADAVGSAAAPLARVMMLAWTFVSKAC